MNQEEKVQKMEDIRKELVDISLKNNGPYPLDFEIPPFNAYTVTINSEDKKTIIEVSINNEKEVKIKLLEGNCITFKIYNKTDAYCSTIQLN